MTVKSGKARPGTSGRPGIGALLEPLQRPTARAA
jgi:hypothetical protein